MNWSDIEGAVAKISPFLGAAIGGPAGAAVGSLIAKGLGTSNTPDAVLAAIGDPQVAIQLKNIELQQNTNILNMLQTNNAGQIAIDQTAQASDKWYSHWRDAAGWVAVIGLFYGTVGMSIITLVVHAFAPAFVMPSIDTGTLIALLVNMLGLSGIHAEENVRLNS